MSRLVVVVPLIEGARKRAEELIAKGPPFEIGGTQLERHEVFVTDREVIFDFETAGSEPPIALQAEDPTLLEGARPWGKVMSGSPRKAQQVFAWRR
jgi:hypothetical protein